MTDSNQTPYGSDPNRQQQPADWSSWLNQSQQPQQPSQQPVYRDLYPQQAQAQRPQGYGYQQQAQAQQQVQAQQAQQQAQAQQAQQQAQAQQQVYGRHSQQPQDTRQAPPTWQTTQQPNYAAQAGGAEAQKKEKRKSGKGAAFASGLVGAVLGLALGAGAMYGILDNAQPASSGTGSSTTITLGQGAGSSSGPVTITPAAEDTSLAEAVAMKSSPSVVSVYVYVTQTNDYYPFFGGGSSGEATESLYATGSGVIITSDGYIITNEHVVSDAERVTVLIDGEEYAAEIVGTDPSSDIAVLKTEKEGLTPVDIGDSDAVRVGEWCMTLGSPYGLDQSASSGIVSAKYRSTAMESTTGVAIYANLIQTDAAINSGSSGGALLDSKGALIGITTLTTSSGFSIGFAIPVNYAMSIAQQIIDTGEAHHAYLGVSMASLDSSLAQQIGVDLDSGVYLSDVTPGLAASEAGLKEGDIIVGIDNNPITTAASLIMTVRTYDIGDTVTITYVRDGETQTCECTLSSDEGQSVAGTTTQHSQGDSGYGGGNGGGRPGR